MTQPNQSPLVGQYRLMRQQLTSSMISMMIRLWMGLRTYRDADVARFQQQAQAILRGSQTTLIALTSSYLQQMARQAGAPWQPVTLPSDFLSTVRDGVTFADEYARPFQQLWTALSQGDDLAKATQVGLTRLESLAATDLQLAATHAAQSMLGGQPPQQDGKLGVVGYERVPTSGHPCALCLIASTQRYKRDDLMPIHPGCQCIVEPIWGTEPIIDRVINPDLLTQVHQAIIDQFGEANYGARFVPGQDFNYRDVLIVHDHGEIGPVLAVRGQHFETAAQAAELVGASS